jgi:hypothetical protein
VRRAHGRHEVRVEVSVDGHRTGPAQLAAQQREKLLERVGPLPGRGDGHVVPVEAGTLVVAQVVSCSHRRYDEADAAGLQVGDLARPPLGTVSATSSPRPLERAQLARARPPDSPGLHDAVVHAP